MEFEQKFMQLKEDKMKIESDFEDFKIMKNREIEF